MTDADTKKTCSICLADYTGWGNNAAPFEGRCCNSCNLEFVIPARLKRMAITREDDELRRRT